MDPPPPDFKYDNETDQAAQATEDAARAQNDARVAYTADANPQTKAALEAANLKLRSTQIKFMKATAKYLGDVAKLPIDGAFWDKIDFSKPIMDDAQPNLNAADKANLNRWKTEFQNQLGGPFEKAMNFDKLVDEFGEEIKNMPKDAQGNPILTDDFRKRYDAWVDKQFESSWTDSAQDLARKAWQKLKLKHFIYAGVLSVAIWGTIKLINIIEHGLCNLAAKSSGCYVTVTTSTTSSRSQVQYNNFAPKDCTFGTCCNEDATCTSASVSDTCAGFVCCNQAIDAQNTLHQGGVYAYHCDSAIDWLYNLASGAGADLSGIWNTIKTILIYFLIGCAAVAGLLILYRAGSYIYMHRKQARSVPP